MHVTLAMFITMGGVFWAPNQVAFPVRSKTISCLTIQLDFLLDLAGSTAIAQPVIRYGMQAVSLNMPMPQPFGQLKGALASMLTVSGKRYIIYLWKMY